MVNNNKNIEIPHFTIEDLLKNGVHYGHRTGARNPKMLPYIYGEVAGTHLIDLRQSKLALERALKFLVTNASQGKRILFVSTNPKFQEQVEEVATSCGQHSTRHWRGGTLTNWKMSTSGVHALKDVEKFLSLCESKGSEENVTYTKKEISRARSKHNKLYKCFHGRENMAGMPDVIVLLGLRGEELVVQETRCIGTPVIGIADTNSDPTKIEYPIYGNDNSIRAMRFYCNLFSQAVIIGTKIWLDEQAKKQSKAITESIAKVEANKNEIKNTSDKVAESKKKEGDTPISSPEISVDAKEETSIVA